MVWVLKRTVLMMVLLSTKNEFENRWVKHIYSQLSAHFFFFLGGGVVILTFPTTMPVPVK